MFIAIALLLCQFPTPTSDLSGNTAANQPEVGTSVGHRDNSAAVQPTSTGAPGAAEARSNTGLLANPSYSPRAILASSEELRSNTEVRPLSPATRTLLTERHNQQPSHANWLWLSAVQHGAAAFDAWTTRRAVDRGGRELNPFLRPVADSNALYTTIQITPAATTYLAYKMRRSDRTWMRRFWWVPQLATAAVHIGSGAHNMRVAKRLDGAR